jgi:hypothetical protein
MLVFGFITDAASASGLLWRTLHPAHVIRKCDDQSHWRRFAMLGLRAAEPEEKWEVLTDALTL